MLSYDRYHLQALRHLYVLAAEPRLLVPRDIESKQLVSCHVDVELRDTPWYKGRTLTLTGPVMLAELKFLKRVTIQDSRYHQVCNGLSHFSNYELSYLMEAFNPGEPEYMGTIAYSEAYLKTLNPINIPDSLVSTLS